MTASLSKKEFLGDMPPNKTYKVRQSYWTVFTHPGCYLGGVVEIREARNHGAVVKLSLYTVMEKDPATPDGRRRFVYTKPAREWKGTEAKEYDVYYRAGSRKAGPGENYCSCEGFQRQSKCKHLEALLSLANRNPVGVGGTTPTGQAHEWERRGPKSFRCVRCGMRAWNPDMVDRSSAAVCVGQEQIPEDQPAPAEPVKKPKRVVDPEDTAGGWSVENFNLRTDTLVKEEHNFLRTNLKDHDTGDRIYRCVGCGVGTTCPDDHEGSGCRRPRLGRPHRFTECVQAGAYNCNRCGLETTNPHDRTGEVCPGKPAKRAGKPAAGSGGRVGSSSDPGKPGRPETPARRSGGKPEPRTAWEGAETAP